MPQSPTSPSSSASATPSSYILNFTSTSIDESMVTIASDDSGVGPQSPSPLPDDGAADDDVMIAQLTRQLDSATQELQCKTRQLHNILERDDIAADETKTKTPVQDLVSKCNLISIF